SAATEISTLSYTTLFRSEHAQRVDQAAAGDVAADDHQRRRQPDAGGGERRHRGIPERVDDAGEGQLVHQRGAIVAQGQLGRQERSEEHTSELQSLAYLVC